MAVSLVQQMETTLAQDVGWLLANARQYSGVDGVETAAGFARAGAFEPVHRSAVVRWEHGQVPITHDIVRRYETVLGLPYGRLLSAVEYLAQLDDRHNRIPFLTAPWTSADRDVAQALFDRALDGDALAGQDWDRLTGFLQNRDEWLIRSVDWEALIRRLALEVSVHVGLEFTLRDQSLIRLAAHPRSAAALTAMARRTLDDPTTQVYADTVGLLQHSADPDGTTLLLEYLEHPTAESGLWVCLFTTATRVRRGLLTPAQTVRAAQIALGLMRDEARSVRIHRESANLLRRIDPPTRSRIINALSAESRKRIAHIVAQGSAVADHEVDALTRSLEVRLRRTMGMTRWTSTLDRLVRTAVTTTHDEERGRALAVLMLTPQAPAVASAYATRLSEAWLNDEPTLVDDALGALSWVAQPGQADELVELAFQAANDPITTLTAAGAAANARVTRRTAARITARTSALAADQLRRAHPDPKSLARAHAYLLGMWGQTERLADLAGQASLHGVSREWLTSFQWWLELPEWARPDPLPR
jgi:hypothetical protein